MVFQILVNKIYLSDTNRDLLSGINIDIYPGKLTVLMGPNGIGKSSLLNAIMKHPKYGFSGNLILDDKDVTSYSTENLVREGIAYIAQHTPDIEGISLNKLALSIGKIFYKNAREYKRALNEIISKIKINPEFLNREIKNFSGGERKRIEFLLAMLKHPKYYLIDEIDSGLDVDSLKLIASLIAQEISTGKGILIITHTGKLISELEKSLDSRSFLVYVIKKDRTMLSGDLALVKKVEEMGYDDL